MFESEKATIREYLTLFNGDENDFHRKAPYSMWSDDIVYEIIGTTPVSGVMRGLEEIKAKLFDPFWERLAEIELVADELVALEDGRILMVGHTVGRAKNGRPYNQQYLYVYTVEDGKITHILKHCDTALIETSIYGRDLVEPETAVAS